MNVFVMPGSPGHIEASIKQGVNIGKYDKGFEKKVKEHCPDDIVRLWGLTSGSYDVWERVEPDDYVLFYQKGALIFVGRVCFKYPIDPNNGQQLEVAKKISRRVWGSEKWLYLVFLKDVREINLPLLKFAEIAGYSRNIKYIRGAMRLSDDKAGKIIEYLEREVYKEERPQKVYEEEEKEELHDRLVDIVYKLSDLLNYEAKKEVDLPDGSRLDIAWYTSDASDPKLAFEIVIKGDIKRALYNLLSAYDAFMCKLFIITTKDQLESVKSRVRKGPYKIRDKVIVLSAEEVMEYYEFKEKFKRLEEVFQE